MRKRGVAQPRLGRCPRADLRLPGRAEAAGEDRADWRSFETEYDPLITRHETEAWLQRMSYYLAAEHLRLHPAASTPDRSRPARSTPSPPSDPSPPAGRLRGGPAGNNQGPGFGSTLLTSPSGPIPQPRPTWPERAARPMSVGASPRPRPAPIPSGPSLRPNSGPSRPSGIHGGSLGPARDLHLAAPLPMARNAQSDEPRLADQRRDHRLTGTIAARVSPPV
jgi:hypothetical protein